MKKKNRKKKEIKKTQALKSDKISHARLAIPGIALILLGIMIKNIQTTGGIILIAAGIILIGVGIFIRHKERN